MKWGDEMQLADKHYKCIELIIKGYKYTEIAKMVPCNRQSIYNWLDDNEFKAELDKCRREIKKQAENKVLSKVDIYMDKVEELAFKSDSDNVKLNALELLLERSLGKVTTKIEQSTESQDNKDNNEDIDIMIERLKKENNIISLDDVKSNKEDKAILN